MKKPEELCPSDATSGPECPGPNCMMCNGETCNFCGAGCWDPSVDDCEHDTAQRHGDPVFGAGPRTNDATGIEETLRWYATVPRDADGATMPLDLGERARRALGMSEPEPEQRTQEASAAALPRQVFETANDIIRVVEDTQEVTLDESVRTYIENAIQSDKASSWERYDVTLQRAIDCLTNPGLHDPAKIAVELASILSGRWRAPVDS